MKIDKDNKNHVQADEGKVLRRLSDGWVAGKEIYLGYCHNLKGKKLKKAFVEKIDDYEEIDEPVTDTEDENKEVSLDTLSDEDLDRTATLQMNENSDPLSVEPDNEVPLSKIEYKKTTYLTNLLSQNLQDVEQIKKTILSMQKEINKLKKQNKS